MLKRPLNTVHMRFGDAIISEFVHHFTGFISAKFGAFFTKCTIFQKFAHIRPTMILVIFPRIFYHSFFNANQSKGYAILITQVQYKLKTTRCLSGTRLFPPHNSTIYIFSF